MINKINNYLLLIVTLGAFLTAFSLAAHDRYVNYEGQGIWTSEINQPAVKVFIQASSVKVKLLSDSKSNDLPAITLKRINSHLLNEYTSHFIKIQDFDKDGWMDIGVLKSAGVAGSKLCYSVFEYKPDFYSYSSRVTKTVCVE